MTPEKQKTEAAPAEAPRAVEGYQSSTVISVEGALERRALLHLIAQDYGLDERIKIDFAALPKRSELNAQFRQWEDGTITVEIVPINRAATLAQEAGATEAVTVEPGGYRKREDGEVWHVCTNCSDYPSDEEVAAGEARRRVTKPDEPERICSECTSKIERGECEK